MAHNSVRTLLTGLIDYAGLFPPASLTMKQAVRNYLAYREGESGWILGRFVVPVSRIEELRAEAGKHPVSAAALIDGTAEGDLAVVQNLDMETVELKASTPAQVRAAAARIPSSLTAYFEIPLTGDPRELIRAIEEVGARAKVRTGGLTPDAIPGSRDLARFLNACGEQGVAFKATAGLHHPMRGEYPLTYEKGSPRVVMHGFLNLFLAAAFIRAGLEPGQVVRLLEDQKPSAFTFEPEGVSWRDEYLDVQQIADARQNLAISFGSCSFDEPIAELKQLHLL